MKFLFVAILLMCSLAKAEDVMIKQDAEVSGQNITLGMLAPSASAELSGLILGEAPARGKYVVWSAADVSHKLRAYQAALNGIKFKIPKRVKITKLDSQINEIAVKEKITVMLKSLLPDTNWDVQLLSLQKIQWPELSEAAQWNVVPLTQRPRGAAQFEIVIQDQGKTLHHLWVNGIVSYSALVPVAQKIIPARKKILAEDITWEKRNVTYVNEIPSTEKDFEAAVTRLSLNTGTIITKNHLERELALKFGQEVEVLAGSDDFSISTRAVSQQNAYIGDVVKLRTANSSKILTGVAVAKGQVQINY